MPARVIVDTNVLVYAYDPSEPAKQLVASRVLDLIRALGIGVISVQSLSEFFSVATRKLKPPFPPEVASKRIENLIQTWKVLDLTPAVVLEAARGVKEHQLAWWDSLIWAAARLHQVGIALSEDFTHDRVIEGVRFKDPFRAGFSPESLKDLAG